MHSYIVEIFNEESKSKKSIVQDLAIILQHRYWSLWVDNIHQKQLEMFLGLRGDKHFSTLLELP